MLRSDAQENRDRVLEAARELIVDDGCADPDPWRGFCAVIERLNVLNSRNHGFVDAFMSASPGVAVFAEHRAALLRKLAALGARAQATGGLRAVRLLSLSELAITPMPTAS